MASNDADAVMTVTEVAEFLKLGESTIYRLAQTNKLPARKVGGVWRFSREALDEWLAHKPATEKLDRPPAHPLANP
jgi:excisionase family DNA binding protein